MNQRYSRYPASLLAVVFAAVLWSAWLFSLASGEGNKDRFEQVIGTDFVVFYTAGNTVLESKTERLYDQPFQRQRQQELLGTTFSGFYHHLTPPLFSYIFAPFASFHYTTAFFLWCMLGLFLLWHSLRLLGYPLPLYPFALALTCFPAFATIAYGQNGFLSLFILSLVYYLWKRERLLEAGLAASLLFYKPQLLIGLGLLWLFRARSDFRALLGLLVGTVAGVALSILLLPEASQAYFQQVLTHYGDLATESPERLKKQLSVLAFWWQLLPGFPATAAVLSWLTKALALVSFLLFSRRVESNKPMLFSAAVFLTFCLSPYVMIYDGVLLLLAAVLIWLNAPDSRVEWKKYLIILWLALLLGTPLVDFQLRLFPFAIQLSTLAVVGIAVHWWLTWGGAADDR